MIKVVLCGAAASGKDLYAKRLVEKGAKKSVSYTTRPIRKNEIDGEDYHFITVEEFKQKIEEGFWYEWDLFRPEEEWYYGASREDVETCDLYIKTPAGVASLDSNLRKECTIIYLDIEEKVRRERLETRNDSDSVERRITTDREAFKDFKDFDIIIKNFDF